MHNRVMADFILYDKEAILAEPELIGYSVQDLYHDAEEEMDIESFCTEGHMRFYGLTPEALQALILEPVKKAK